VALACDLAERKHVDAAFAAVEMAADAALLDEDWAAAATALDEFAARVPNHIPALMKLVEICVDGGLESRMYRVQGQLADAYLAAGLGAEARVISEDLVAREPWVPANLDRFRRALLLLGVLDPDTIIVERLSGENPFTTTPGRFDLPAPSEVDGTTATPGAIDQDAAVEIVHDEIDLNDALAELGSAPPDLETVFEDLRARAESDGEATDARRAYEAGLARLRDGRTAEAIDELQAAARSPLMRFQASAELGRLFVSHGELGRGIDWMERAAEAPAPDAHQGHALLYDLADTLERLGEGARALAVLLELRSDAGPYRDVESRIERLTRVQTEG
jgi:hypothetical protein